MDETTPPIAVMDATCALCSWGARMIHRLDTAGRIKIAPIQGETGAALMRTLGLDAMDPNSWLFIVDGRVWQDSDALIALGQTVGGIGWVSAMIRLIPRNLRNRLYRFVARNRYRMFGRADMCALPDPAFRARLLP